MKCLIVDDNKIARSVLKHFLSALDYVSLAGDCESVAEAVNIMSREKIDLLLLDVEMPGMSGFDFLNSFPEHPMVILITAKAEYAVSAFDHNVVDFLLKPVAEPRFIKAIQRAWEIYKSDEQNFETEKDFFFIREKGVSSRLMISDILYIQALGDYITIHTSEKKFTIHYSISAIEKKLSPARFMRVHRSYILALDKIETVEEGTAFVYQQPIPVGDAHRSQLMKRLNLL
jgi:DNA-binding LytR/AlgR family response regulator